MRIFLFLATILLSYQVVAQFPTTSLTVSYPFTNGSTNDVSGSGNHLTAFNGPTPCPDRFNNPNCAYLFDGANDYMKAISPGPMNRQSRSIVFWAKTTAAFNSNGYTVLHYGEGNTGGGRIEFGLNSSCNSVYVDYGFGFVSKSFATTDNQWHMYSIVYDSTISYQITSVKYYVDAVLQSVNCFTYNTGQTINTQPGDPINIGRFLSTNTRYFNGAIDDIHVYARPLTPGELITIYTLPNTIGKDALDASAISVFPNPTTDKIQITGFKEGSVSVYNVLGETMKVENAGSLNLIDLSALPKGIYYLRLQSGNASVVKKVIKK
jgi:hypothetical protein